MPQTHPGSISESAAEVVRAKTGAPAAADSSTINDTNFPPADATNCGGWRKVLLTPVFTGGSGPTVTIQTLTRMGDRWVAGAASSGVDAGGKLEVEVGGRLTFFRIASVTGDPTEVQLLCGGSDPFRFDGGQRG